MAEDTAFRRMERGMGMGMGINDDSHKRMIDQYYRDMLKKMDDALLFGDTTRPAYHLLGRSIHGQLIYGAIPVGMDIASAIRGDDRPAPNADEWETQMLRRLAGEAMT